MLIQNVFGVIDPSDLNPFWPHLAGSSLILWNQMIHLRAGFASARSFFVCRRWAERGRLMDSIAKLLLAIRS